MTLKKIISISLAAALICTSFAACSSKKTDEAANTTSNVVEVEDEDDTVKVTVAEDDEESTIELTDKSGNVLTIVPIYNSDGVTVIAGYIESAKDKSGKALTEKDYEYIKTVIALEITEVDGEKSYAIKYSEDNKPVTITALSDSNGYIIALQDATDIDGDKDTQEYFKAVTKLDSQNNLFIKLDKDQNGKLINVTVEKSSDNKKVTVVDSAGKKTAATDTKQAKNLIEVVEEKAKETTASTQKNTGGNSANSSNSSNSSGNQNQSSNDNQSNSNENTGSSDKEEESPITPITPAVDYVSIVLKDNGKVSCDADNVTINEASAVNGGTEVIVNGAGEFSKYYVTSETSTFAGQLEFRFSVDEDVEVKVNNVNISTVKKTAIKFTNVDAEVDKENDSEETGVGGSIGSSVVTAAPSVEFSITGTNSFKANGSGKNGTIYSECKLGIKGHGSAEIDGGQSLSGICSTESITIKNATLNIISRAKQGISCDKKVTVEAGATINIESLGDGIHCNKFLFDGAEEGSADSKIKIRSLSSVNCSDGIDS
ncbi:MAG: hypothetical protein ACI4RF_08920, partial [Eubacterium sp.]